MVVLKKGRRFAIHGAFSNSKGVWRAHQNALSDDPAGRDELKLYPITEALQVEGEPERFLGASVVGGVSDNRLFRRRPLSEFEVQRLLGYW